MKYPNVFNFPFSARFYLTHPHKWFKELFTNIKSAWMRATKGWCYEDAWNWDSWFLTVAPSMLQHIARYGSAYPGVEPFTTAESWHDWLEDIAAKLISCHEEEIDKHNEYYEEYLTSFKDIKDIEKIDELGNKVMAWPHNSHHDEISKLYFARDKELNEEAQKNLEYALSQILTYFHFIWD